VLPRIKPFKAFHYNPQLIKDFSSVVCPPYDVIDEKEEINFKKRSPYNFCNILLANREKDYKCLAKKFNDWITKGILVQDDQEYFYLYEQTFFYEGREIRRVGMLSLLRLEKGGVIFPHEGTLKEPKEDRFCILKEIEANLEPIFVLSSQRINTLGEIYEAYAKRKPFISFKDFTGVRVRLWKVGKVFWQKKLCEEIVDREFIIADGHHRFEVACSYYQKYKDKFKDLNYILAYFSDPTQGIVILPTHRIIKVRIGWEEARQRLEKYFCMEPIEEAHLKDRFSQAKRLCFGIYREGKFYYLELKKEFILDKIMEGEESKIYRDVDIYFLHNFVFKLSEAETVKYIHTMGEVKRLTQEGEVCFLVKPIALNTIFRIAKKGYRLPQKSTYFYPKLLNGLVIRKFFQGENLIVER